MKLQRRDWTQVHNWLGVLITPPLAVIVFTGIVLFFHDALNQWEFARAPQLSLGQAMDQAAQRLEEDGTLVAGGNLSFYPAEGQGFPLLVSAGKGYQAVLADGTLVADAVHGSAGRALLEVHYALSLPMGIYLAGLVALLMLVLLMNGLVVHWPNLKRQWQQYRGQSGKDRWLDLHKLVGVATLPYLLMYALTGAAFCLLVFYQALLLLGPYQGDRSAILADMGFPQVPKATGLPLAQGQLPPSILLAQSQQLLEAQPNRLTIAPWQDQAQQVITAASRGRELIESQELRFVPGADTPLESLTQDNMGPARLVFDSFTALHYGHFGGQAILWLFSLLGLGTLAMLFGGALRAQGRLVPGSALYRWNRQGLVLAGSLPLGTLALLLAGRYLPMDSALRYWAFPWIFWIATLAPVLWPLAKGQGRRRVAWLWWSSGLLALVAIGSLLQKGLQGQLAWLVALALGLGLLAWGGLKLTVRKVAVTRL